MRPFHRLAILTTLALAWSSSLACAQTTLRYRFKEGEDLHYVVEQKTKITNSINGMDVESNLTMTMQLAWNVLKVDSFGNAQTRLKVTHARMAMDAITGVIVVDSSKTTEHADPIGKLMAPIVNATAAMEMTFTMMPTGEMKEVKLSDTCLQALKNIPGADAAASPDTFKAMVHTVVFPVEAVTKGKTWTQKIEAKTPAGLANIDNVYTYDGVVEQGKVKLDKIIVKPRITIEPDPKSPAKFEIKAVRGAGATLFDNKLGRVVEVSSQQTMQLAISANGMEQVQTNEQTTTLRLKKK